MWIVAIFRSDQGFLMPYPIESLKPIVVHLDSEIPPPRECQSSRSFFCLDGEEFCGDRLSEKVAEIRLMFGRSVPIVVIGISARDQSEIHQESNRITEAGAIYLERPKRGFNLDGVAAEICRELSRIYEGFEPFSSPASQEPETTEERRKEQQFYAA